MKKHKLFAHTTVTSVAVETLSKGEFVRRKPEAKEVYTVDRYNRATKRYTLIAESDHCKVIEVEKGTLLTVGFEY